MLGADPLVYNNSAWYLGQDPFLVGRRDNFMIQSVSLEAMKSGGALTGAMQAILKFNYGVPDFTPTMMAAMEMMWLPPYTLSVAGRPVELRASDLFFRESGVIRYGVPLVGRSGPGTVNGQTYSGSFDAGDLYEVVNGIGTLTSDQVLPVGTSPALFGSGRTVWLNGPGNPAAMASGTVLTTMNGVCSETHCPVAEITVVLNIQGAAMENTPWYAFLTGIAEGTITPYFTGSICGNDLLDPQPVPEPGMFWIALSGLGTILWRGCRLANRNA